MSNYHKQKCENLRQIRVKMAETLGIPDAVRKEPCNFKGECSGTCPACYMEERVLMDKIYEMYNNGMMDMIFGDDIKELKVLANDYIMGEDEPFDLSGDISMPYDVEDVEEFPNEFDIPLKPVGPSPTPPTIPMSGQAIVPPWEQNGITNITDKPKENKKNSSSKLSRIFKGNNR